MAEPRHAPLRIGVRSRAVSEDAGPPPRDAAETQTEAGWPGEAASVPQAERLPGLKLPSTAGAAPVEHNARRFLSRKRALILLSAIAVVLAAVAGWAIFAMHANEQRALSWQRRAQKLQANSTQLEALLTARTSLLNQRIDQLNRLAGRLRVSQVALNQSQGDVSSLEERQRQLANEKAQLQDQQRALDNVAGAYVSCKQDLVQLLADVANGYDTTYPYGTANTDCTNADTSLQSYLSAYPNG